jgi:hypothetical protein
MVVINAGGVGKFIMTNGRFDLFSDSGWRVGDPGT